jgi:hypothetical protein
MCALLVELQVGWQQLLLDGCDELRLPCHRCIPTMQLQSCR